MPIGSSGVANFANTQPGTAENVVADVNFINPYGENVAGGGVVCMFSDIASVGDLLQESGFHLLQENGFLILL
jgi:hypothetical protein